MLQTLSAREPNDWQQCSPIRSAWLVEIRSALGEPENPKFNTDYELYRSIDSLMTDVTTIVSTMAQFDQLLTKRSTVTGLDSEDSDQILIDLYDTAENILSRNEARLARWNTNICEISLSSWLSLYLLLSDVLTLMVRTNVDGMPANSRQKIEDHRIQLMKYALNVLRTVCYATHTESRAVAPFAFATVFQLTVAVLERECKSLQAAAGSNEDRIRRCEGLKSLAVRYLDWAMQNKIPVKIDLDCPKKWEFGSIA